MLGSDFSNWINKLCNNFNLFFKCILGRIHHNIIIVYFIQRELNYLTVSIYVFYAITIIFDLKLMVYMETKIQNKFTTFLQKHGNVPKGNGTLL